MLLHVKWMTKIKIFSIFGKLGELMVWWNFIFFLKLFILLSPPSTRNKSLWTIPTPEKDADVFVFAQQGKSKHEVSVCLVRLRDHVCYLAYFYYYYYYQIKTFPPPGGVATEPAGCEQQ